MLCITFLSLLLGELVPKNLALRYPEKITLLLAPLMRFIARATLPAVATLALCSRLVQKTLRLGPAVEPHMTEEELRHTIEQATQSGVLVKTEQQLLERTFSLGDRQVTAFMTPRTDVVWLDLNDPLETTWRTIRETNHTHLVVCREELDEVVGVVHILRLWKELNRSGENNLAGLVKPPLFVPEKISALRVLELMKNHDCHLLVVLDEYGGVSGLVSLRDLVTSVFFGSSTRVEPEEPMAVQREDGSWLLSGLMPIEEFASIFRLLESESAELDEYETLGGFVMNTIGKIPSVADSIERFGLRLEVVDMDGRRVDKVLVQRLGPPPETHGDEVPPPVASEEENEREE